MLIFYTIKPCYANFFWIRSKNREIENRVKQGITVYTYQKENLRNFSNVYLIT